jgi:hypothetical protein
MIKEIVPFPKIHTTVLIVTGVYIRSSTGLRVEELDMTEGPSVGNVCFPVEHTHIYVFSSLTLKGRVEREIKMVSEAALQSFPRIGTRLHLRGLSLFNKSRDHHTVVRDFLSYFWLD